MSLINLFYWHCYLNISGITNTYSNKLHINNRVPYYRTMVSNRGIHTSSKGLNKPLIWVYDVTDLSRNLQGLVKGAPFKTKSECANILQISRNTVTAYLDKGKLFNNKWIFSSTTLSKEELSKWVVPSEIWEILTGELLGDGYINYDPLKNPLINGRIEFTFSAKILHYVNYLKYHALASICTSSKPTPWPNPELTGKDPKQYWFSTKRLPAISNLHQLWYKAVDGKYIKILPLNLEELLTPVALAHWIMGDGYFTDGCLKICTDNFTEEEVLRLINILHVKFGIKASINKRTNPDGEIKWRIRVSKLSMDKLITIVSPYIIPEMYYKLGLKNE